MIMKIIKTILLLIKKTLENAIKVKEKEEKELFEKDLQTYKKLKNALKTTCMEIEKNLNSNNNNQENNDKEKKDLIIPYINKNHIIYTEKTTESEYLKVEDLSDGVGFCQIIEAFFKGVSHELNNLKFNAINDIEQKQKNLSIFNVILGKAGCPRQIDPIKMSRGIFSLNLEFLQYLFDFLYKTFGTVAPNKKYNGLKRRLEILKNQGNKNLKNINKLLPPHLITNRLSFQMIKMKIM